MIRRPAWLLATVCVVLLAAPSAQAKPKTHLVFAKQTLGKIAKRYNVTVDAILEANGIDKRDPIQPGQRLCIPPRSDKDGSVTRERCEAWRKERGDRGDDPRAKHDDKDKHSDKHAEAKAGKRRAADGGVRWHTVYKGQHLGMIARRYNVTVAALTNANEISKRAPIVPGQKLLIPARDDVDGTRARALLDDGPPPELEPDEVVRPKHDKAPKHGKAKSSWDPYVKKPAVHNRVNLTGRKDRNWRGTTLTRKGNVRKAAREAFNRVLATRDGQQADIHPRLIKLITDVSNTFGGRDIRVVSGYRLGRTSRSSRHRKGFAVDFIVVGVPNEAVRDYVKTFAGVGVGYYPNSHFVHLDVRQQWTYWIDYAGPGQPPRYAGFWTRRPRSK